MQRCRREAGCVWLWLLFELHLAQAADLEQATCDMGEREAAATIGGHRPKLSMECLKPLNEFQGCSISDEWQEESALGSSACFI